MENSVIFQEAFQRLKMLNEEDFNIEDTSEIEDLDAFVEDDNIEDEVDVDVMDSEAESQEDLKDSYMGNVILYCPVCETKIFKKPDEVIIDEESGLANVDEECPYCYSVGGYHIIGDVCPHTETEVDVEVTPKDEEEISDVDEEIPEDESEIEEDYKKGPAWTYKTDMYLLDKKTGKKISYRELTPEKVKEMMDGEPGRYKEIYERIPTPNSPRKRNGFVMQESKPRYIDKFDELMAKLAAVYGDDNLQIPRTDSVSGIDVYCNDIGAEEAKNLADEFGFDYAEIAGGKAVRILAEGIENLDIETSHDTIHIESQEKPDADGEMIAPVTPELEDNILGAEEEEIPEEETFEEPTEDDDFSEEPEEGNPEDEVDLSLDDFDEDTFDEMGESYMKRVYENISSYKTKKATVSGNTLKLEGVIKFKSGKTKNTSFIFEAYDATKSGRVRFTGMNDTFSRGKKAFTLTGRFSRNTFISESLNYNYRQKTNEGVSTRVYGTIKLNG